MMKNINKLALLLKLNVLRSIAASLSWRSPVIALKQALELHRTPLEWTTKSLLWSDILSGRPHESQQSSFTMLSSRAIFMYLWIRLSLVIQHTSCAVFFLWKNLRVFMNPNSAGIHWTFHFQIICLRQKKKKKKKKKTSGKSVKLNLPN